MNDTRSIIITLRPETDDGTNVANQTGVNGKSKDKKQNSTKATFAALAFQGLKEIATQGLEIAEFEYGKHLLLNDDYIGERKKNIAITQISRATSYVSKIGSYTALGAHFGPAGAFIGALVGFTTSAVDIISSNYKGAEQQKIQLNQMQAQLDFTRSRTGARYSLKSASIGEDL